VEAVVHEKFDSEEEMHISFIDQTIDEPEVEDDLET
jgi:hypothetical protein